MKRLALFGALVACGALLAAGPAAAASDIPKVERTCTTTSKNVTTKNVRGKVVGTNVDRLQARFARCRIVKKVMNEMLGLRIEKPKVFEGFNCTPTVLRTEPDVVRYRCIFKGADTATFIRLTFTARYDMD